ATATKDAGTVAAAGQHCLLSGPDDNTQDLISGLPTGGSASEGQTLIVKRGTVVLQAANQNGATAVNPSSPAAQFFVLKDNVSLQGQDITNPQQSTDTSGSPDVSFGFTSKGKTAFQDVTAT